MPGPITLGIGPFSRSADEGEGVGTVATGPTPSTRDSVGHICIRQNQGDVVATEPEGIVQRR